MILLKFFNKFFPKKIFQHLQFQIDLKIFLNFLLSFFHFSRDKLREKELIQELKVRRSSGTCRFQRNRSMPIPLCTPFPLPQSLSLSPPLSGSRVSNENPQGWYDLSTLEFRLKKRTRGRVNWRNSGSTALRIVTSTDNYSIQTRCQTIPGGNVSQRYKVYDRGQLSSSVKIFPTFYYTDKTTMCEREKKLKRSLNHIFIILKIQMFPSCSRIHLNLKLTSTFILHVI